MFDKLKNNDSEFTSLNIFNDFIEIPKPIYKKIIIKENNPIFLDEQPQAGDRVYQEDNRKLYLPDDVVMDDIPTNRIIRDDEIFKDTLTIPCTIIVDDEFATEFYEKVQKGIKTY